MSKYRYTILLDRYEDEDWGPEQARLTAASEAEMAGFHDGSDEQAIKQVAAELQEAMDESGLPAGFFDIIKRERVSDE